MLGRMANNPQTPACSSLSHSEVKSKPPCLAFPSGKRGKHFSLNCFPGPPYPPLSPPPPSFWGAGCGTCGLTYAKHVLHQWAIWSSSQEWYLTPSGTPRPLRTGVFLVNSCPLQVSCARANGMNALIELE